MKLICIIGTGRSGSTLLDMVLGSHSKIFSLGEIMDMEYHLRHNTKCACSKHIMDCEFWAPIIFRNKEDIILEDYILNYRNKKERYLYLIKHFLRKQKSNHKFIRNYSTLLDFINKKSKYDIYIDSSKSPIRALILNNNIVDYNIVESVKIIYIIRDARSYMFSRLNSPDNKSTSFFLAWEWMKQNILSLIVYSMINKKDKFFLRYEDLANEPEEKIVEITNFLEIEYEQSMLNFRSFIHHNVGGNSMKFGSSNIKKPSENWREKFTAKQNFAYNLFARLLNRAFNYK